MLGGVGSAVDGHMVIFAHVALDGSNGAVSIGDSLTLCHLTDHTLAGLCKCNHGRSGAVALCIGDYNGFAAFQNGNTGIGSTKVNTDNLRHNIFPPIYLESEVFIS